MKKAIVLVSGGMDSCVVSTIAKLEGYDLAFLHISYGQRTEKRELKAFTDIANYFNVEQRLVVDINYLKEIGGSSLTNYNIPIPTANLESSEIPNSYVPFRNANILSIATSWAEVIDARVIYIGAVEEDSSGYPDCRRSFFDSFENTIKEGTKPETRISILTPIINLSKKEIILKANKLNAPLHLTWSCYENDATPCGECESCKLRARGFSQAGIIDPIL